MSTIQELEAIVAVAQGEYALAVQERDAAWRIRQKRIDDLTAQMKEEHARDFPMISAKALDDAQAALEAARRAHKEANPPIPIGTVLVRWQYKERTEVLEPTSDRGVFCIYRLGDPMLERDKHRPMYALPGVGDFAIRKLKANGKPAKDVVRYDNHNAYFWVPEGKKPNRKNRVRIRL